MRKGKMNNNKSIALLSFIRGFSVYATNCDTDNNFQIEYKSGAFNWIDLKYKDEKYRQLAKCEQLFIKYTYVQ